MERFQSRFLIRPYFLKKVPTGLIFPDEEILSIDNFTDLCQNFFTNKELKENLKHIDTKNEIYRSVMKLLNESITSLIHAKIFVICN